MKLEGANKLQAKLKRISKETDKRVQDNVQSNAFAIAKKANFDAPQMFNTSASGESATSNEVRGSVKAEEVTKYEYLISVNSLMGAYAEFGTGAFVSVPNGWEDVAWSYFKNGKGTIMPTPFFIPNVVKGKRQLIKDLKQTLRTIDK